MVKDFSKIIISGVGVFNTYNKLIDEDISKSYGFKNQLKSLKLLLHMDVYMLA